jgi:hypothetical protein
MKKIFETPSTGNYFFGYYDKSPLNHDNTLLLACKTNFIDRPVTSGDQLELGYFKYKESNKFIKVASTMAWNWQQGCMLQWFPDGTYEKIIYNDIIENKFVSIILNIHTNEKIILPMAYYAISSNCDFILCIDNERHSFYRPNYSYKGINNVSKKEPFLKDDGIWAIEISSKKVKKIITLGQIAKIKPMSSMKGAIHYLEHLIINPSNQRFMFLHRWVLEGGLYSRLYTANCDGSDIYLVNDSGRVTHTCWRNNNQIVGWAGIPSTINAIRKYKKLVKYFIKPLLPIYKKISRGNSEEGNSKLSSFVTGDSYICFNDKTQLKKRISKELLTKDGHPSFSLINNNLMLSDTYPLANDSSKQELFLYDFVTESIIAKDYLNHNKFSKSPMRCDLHPKWSNDGQMVSIDTIDKGHRSIYVYEI